MLTQKQSIFLLVDGETQGPFSIEELRTLWDANEITADTQYWHRGLTHWTPVARYQPPSAEQLRTPPDQIVLTTAPTVIGRVLESEAGIVSALQGFQHSEWAAWVATWKGDYTAAAQATLPSLMRNARLGCLAGLQREAHALNADAVIAVDISLSMIGEAGLWTAHGTAVRVRVEPPPTSASS